MKRCPTCSRTFSDPILSFCIDDGTPLVPIAASGAETTIDNQDQENPAPYQPPSEYLAPGRTRRRALPWVMVMLGLLVVVIAGVSIAAIIFLPKISHQSATPNGNRGVIGDANQNSGPAVSTSSPNANAKVANANISVVTPANANANTNANANVNANISPNVNSSVSSSGAPIDKDQVLAQLTELEQEWTVANLNADKKALARILADDYVGNTASGLQGKVDYINGIKRDTTIERWDFQGLKVTLHGDLATLSGTLKLVVQGQERLFGFTDKFVWRDGRWQATGSEVRPA